MNVKFKEQRGQQPHQSQWDTHLIRHVQIGYHANKKVRLVRAQAWGRGKSYQNGIYPLRWISVQFVIGRSFE